jgi:type II secretory ATPase GspE/PulE/Tfp pilus assembly ATPase PilB-like protein
LLRSEPDVVGLETIPDQETLAAVQDATLQGTLVVAGFDADGFVATLRRLAGLSDNLSALSQSLALVVSQALVRKLCPDCAQKDKLSRAEVSGLEQLAISGGLPALGREFRKARGCRSCGGSGYRKRALLAEAAPFTPRMAQLLIAGATDEELLGAALATGMVSLRARALELVGQGRTSLEEATRVFPLPLAHS